MKLERFEASTERRRLPGRTEQRGAQTGFSVRGAVVFGGIFVAAGAWAALVGLRVIPVNPRSVHAPWWVLTALGVCFALAGIAIWGKAQRQAQAERRRRDAQRRYPNEPALADYAWNSAGFETPRWARAVKAMAIAAALTLFFSIFNYLAFGKEGPWFVKAIVIVFDLILVAVWCDAFKRLGLALKFGGSRIAFARFPYRLGEDMKVRWHPASGLVQAREGTFTLRCVEEWFERRGSGKNENVNLVHEERWRGTWHLDGPTGFPFGMTVEVPFEPPADLPPTQLSATKPIFWEFEVKLEVPGLDFEETYLVPVYAGKS